MTAIAPFAPFALIAAAEAPAAGRAPDLPPFLTVAGSGAVSARPDVAEVQVGVVTQAASAAAALRDNSEAVRGLFTVLATHEVPDRDIQTSRLDVRPRYSRDREGEEPPRAVGYQVTNQARVKVRRPDSLGEVLDGLVKAGANRVQGISFSVAEPEPLLDDARRQAVADARRKAGLYAGAANVKLGRLLRLEDQAAHAPAPPRPLGFARAEAQAVPVARGEQEFRVTVTLTYAID
jgi:uncharacterized protein YggE